LERRRAFFASNRNNASADRSAVDQVIAQLPPGESLRTGGDELRSHRRARQHGDASKRRAQPGNPSSG
jgi:hypothetical protein